VSPGLVEGWEVNNSSAVFRLHVAPVDEEKEARLLALYPSYSAAWAAGGKFPERVLLPSVNLIDGQQFPKADRSGRFLNGRSVSGA
jgi:hypothetical protein